MGYRSQVNLKTTTEGWVLLKLFNDSIIEKEDRPLAYMTVEKTDSGFFKVSHLDIKWYESYNQVKNFNRALDVMVEQDIPFSFIRIGEDVDDIEVRTNWVEDMPDELSTFEPQVDIYDENACEYSTIIEAGEDIIEKGDK